MHGGRVVSVLEGGYSLSSPSEPPPGSRKPRGRARGAVQGGRSDRSDSDDLGANPATKFAQQAGDGGLVKGVLAHVAALSGKLSWH
jgi:hypothetical protein